MDQYAAGVLNVVVGAVRLFSGFLSYLPLMFMAFIMLICGLIGLKRGLKKGVGSLILILSTIVFALVPTLILCSPQLGVFDAIIKSLADFAGTKYDFGILTQLESFLTIIKYYILMFVSPFVFVGFFFFFGIIQCIVFKCIEKKIPVMNKLPKVAQKLGGVGVGFVVGFALVLVLLMPALGTMNAYNGAVQNVSGVLEQTMGEEAEPVVFMFSTVDIVTNSGGTKLIRVLGGDALYNMTSNKLYNGKIVSFKGEITGMGKVLSGFISLAKSNGDYQDGLFDEMAAATEASPLLAMLASDMLSSAANAWSDGDSFLGMDSFGGEASFVQPLMDAILDVFKTSNDDNIADDIRSLGAMFEILNKYGVFSLNESEDDILDIFNNNPVISELVAALESNPRMSEVAKEISNLTMRAFATVVGVPQEGDPNYEEYNELTQAIADSINQTGNMTTEEKKDYVKDEIKNAASDYDVEVEGEVIDQVADKFIEQFGNRTDVTDQEIKDFIAQFQSGN